MKTKIKTAGKTNLIGGLFCSLLIVAIAAGMILCLEYLAGVTLLENDGDRISNYLQMMGISFSVTFITTSLFGGLSDKSEKIYWLSYPESYLIETPLNFMVLSSVSFVCLGLQALVTALLFLPENVRESIFLSSFTIGIGVIVILSYKFTAVFFSRKKIVVRTEKIFDELVADETKAVALQNAVVGLFNNTLEAVETASSNFERASENVALLLKHHNNGTCIFWLEKLVLEIGRRNTAVLLQLVLKLEGEYFDVFTGLLERVAQRKDGSFDASEVLTPIYDIKLKELKLKLGDGVLFVNMEASAEKCELWDGVARELNTMLTKIDTGKVDNCIFLLQNLQELPYELLQNNNCVEKVMDVWSDILETMMLCVKNSDTVAYQSIHKKMFRFLSMHPSRYFDDQFMYGQLTTEQLGEALHTKTARRIAQMTPAQQIYMIDVLEEPSERNRFLLWIANCMTDGTLPLQMWNLQKDAPYKVGGKYYYSDDLMNGIVLGYYEQRNAVKRAYTELKKDPARDIYADNIQILYCEDYISGYVQFLLQIMKDEGHKYHSSLELFLKVIINDILVEERNSFTHDSYDPFADGEMEEETIINRYCMAFDALMGEEDGLLELSKAVGLTDGNGARVNNYFGRCTEEAAQKRGEMLFFLAHLCGIIREREMTEKCLEQCIVIMLKILTNPGICLRRESEANPPEVKECIAILCGNEGFRLMAQNFVSEMMDEEALLDRLYTMSSNHRGMGNPEYAEELLDIAQWFDESLQALGGFMDEKNLDYK